MGSTVFFVIYDKSRGKSGRSPWTAASTGPSFRLLQDQGIEYTLPTTMEITNRRYFPLVELRNKSIKIVDVSLHLLEAGVHICIGVSKLFPVDLGEKVPSSTQEERVPELPEPIRRGFIFRRGVSCCLFESIKVQLPNEAIELGRLEVLTHHFLCKQIRREYNKGVSFSIPGNNVRGLFFQDGVEFIQKARRSLLYSILLCHLNRYVSNCHYNAMNTMDAETPVGTETNFYGMKKSKQL
jgi:hypothetical protein